MAKLSVIIITYNEEDNIRECLESIKWANEVVVVDSFSTDRTVEICKEYTAKVFQNEWTNFPHQKNIALNKVSNEWVLNLDADERVSPELQIEIKSAIARDDDYAGYLLPMKIYFHGRWIRYGGYWPDYHLRLFRKSKGRFNENLRAHGGFDVDGRVGRMKGALIHHSYRNLTDYFEKFNYYTTVSAEEKLASGRKVKWYPFVRLPFEFIGAFIIKRGYRDGFYGLLFSILSSFYAFVKYIKLWELQQVSKDKQTK